MIYNKINKGKENIPGALAGGLVDAATTTQQKIC